jgi:DNA topoisomerase-1
MPQPIAKRSSRPRSRSARYRLVRKGRIRVEAHASKNGGPPADPLGSASAAGLRYVTDGRPGITRRRRGSGWSYYSPAGELIRDAETRRRIAALAIPPAWTDVWICPDRNGHLQATGRDARGRKQYRYHARWREVRDATKFHRMIRFGESLPAVRARVDAALRKRTLSREQVIATVVRLLETTCIRVGNDEYARENGTYGLTTLRRRHVEIEGSKMRFRFEAKGGKPVEVSVGDRRVARVLRDCQEIPGYELFRYVDEEGERRVVGSEDVNAFIRDAAGEDFTAKDFRTWVGTVHAFTRLCRLGPADDEAGTKRKSLLAIDWVAEQLQNTRAVCRSSYIHPLVLRSYEDGLLCELFVDGVPSETRERLDPAEVGLLRLLREATG